ncbi:unnamed protein product [Ilex paraguariensis]|uniref:SAC domain-containing protein n=1 Tax=Ilex paraguariensis TaxID=185542 RepID=A0ABC8QWI2_9AQUA
MEPSDLNISEDPVVYLPQEVKSLLQRVAEGNRATGGLNFIAKVYGIAGCINFLESYYLILVTKRRQIGSICGHAIYCIDESQIITIPHVSVQTDVAHSKTELSSHVKNNCLWGQIMSMCEIRNICVAKVLQSENGFLEVFEFMRLETGDCLFVCLSIHGGFEPYMEDAAGTVVSSW